MTAASLEALLRNIILHRQLPFTFQSVAPAANGWHIVVCDQAGATLSLIVPSGSPMAVRSAFQNHLETAVEDAPLR